MLTYICNICKKEIPHNDAYITQMRAGGIKDKWAFCPRCWSYILLHADEIAAASQAHPKFEHKVTVPEDEGDTVEPEVEETDNVPAETTVPAVPFKVYDGKRLTTEAKEYIMQRYTESDCTYKSIADELKVSISTVYSVIKKHNDY